MNELDAMRQAKQYLDRLARGFNPLTGEPVPEHELVNDVHISRCFFLASDVLRRVIERGGLEPGMPPRKGEKTPFSISREALLRFPYSEEPILVTHIANRVNELARDERQKKLTGTAILNWLEQAGAVEQVTTETGRKSRHPTGLGNARGITLQRRIGPQGEYFAVVYDRHAQKWIVDNMEAIIALARGW